MWVPSQSRWHDQQPSSWLFLDCFWWNSAIPRVPCLLKERRTLVAENIGKLLTVRLWQETCQGLNPLSLPKGLVGPAEPQAINLANLSLRIARLLQAIFHSGILELLGLEFATTSSQNLTNFWLSSMASLKFVMGALLATVHASLRIMTRTLPSTAIIFWDYDLATDFAGFWCSISRGLAMWCDRAHWVISSWNCPGFSPHTRRSRLTQGQIFPTSSFSTTITLVLCPLIIRLSPCKGRFPLNEWRQPFISICS